MSQSENNKMLYVFLALFIISLICVSYVNDFTRITGVPTIYFLTAFVGVLGFSLVAIVGIFIISRRPPKDSQQKSSKSNKLKQKTIMETIVKEPEPEVTAVNNTKTELTNKPIVIEVGEVKPEISDIKKAASEMLDKPKPSVPIPSFPVESVYPKCTKCGKKLKIEDYKINECTRCGEKIRKRKTTESLRFRKILRGDLPDGKDVTPP